MLVPFESLPDHARLWMYQSIRKFNSREVATISNTLEAFTSQWSAHGVPLKASFNILYDQIIILAVDEQDHTASGCSIDDSVRTIREIGVQIGVDLFDRGQIAFYNDNGIMTVPLAQLKQRYQDGAWSQRSLLINVLAAKKGDLENGLLIPAELTWLKRYLPNEKVVG